MPRISYKRLLDQMITEIDAGTNHAHRLDMAKKGMAEHGYHDAMICAAYLQGLTDAHNAVRHIAQKYARLIE
jgi:hypothetical protein